MKHVYKKRDIGKCPIDTAQLAAWLEAELSSPLSTAVPLEIYGLNDPGRHHIERYIAEVFEKNYSARLLHFKPRLLALHSAKGDILAALGLRDALAERLFLEVYLDEPVECRLAAVCGGPVAREGIVEVGNLASRHPGRARCLFRALTIHLYRHGAEWALFTIAPFLRNTFKKLGFKLFHLCPANGARLGEAALDWGSYYDSHPQVMAVNVKQAFQALMAYYESAATTASVRDGRHPAAERVLVMPPHRPDQG